MAKKETFMFKIKRGIDIPPPNAGRPIKYPWSDMAIGDSFAVPRDIRATVVTAARGYSQRHPDYKFIARNIGDETRIWRVPVSEDRR